MKSNFTRNCFLGQWVLLLACSQAAALPAQESIVPNRAWQEAGVPYLQNFSPKDYQASGQNWCVEQDERGIMYFGNNDGVLIYDGVYWKKIRTPRQTVIRSLRNVDGKVYVGARSELGYLDHNTTGQSVYRSLLDLIPVSQRDFTDVQETIALADTIYFRTLKYLFRYVRGRFKIWHPQTAFGKAFVLNGKLYIVQSRIGLMQMLGDSLSLVAGGGLFAASGIAAMLPYDDSKILVVTPNQGLFTFDHERFRPFPTAVDTLIRNAQVLTGATLPGQHFALSIRGEGAILLDKTGNLTQVLNRASGLRDELVHAFHVDSQGGLWMALNMGLARAEAKGPVSLWGPTSGIEGNLTSILRHKNRLWVSTFLGVYYLDGRTTPPTFARISETASQSFALLSAGQSLLAGTDEGVIEISGDRTTLLNTDWKKVRALWRSRQDTNRIYAGLFDGLAVLGLENNRWKDLGRIPDINELIISIAENDDGTLWLGTWLEGVFKVDIIQPPAGEGGGPAARITHFRKERGLPDKRITTAVAAGKVFFATRRGLRRFDAEARQFVPDSSFGSVFADTLCQVHEIREDDNGNVWIGAARGNQALIGRAVPQPDNSCVWEDIPFRLLNDIGNIATIYGEENGVVWFGGSEGIARFDPEIARNDSVDFQTVIRRVKDIATDSLFYGGAGLPAPALLELDYQHNSLRFEFAATSYDNVTANQYQFMLEGFEPRWSAWTGETHKDYTGLPEGDYCFKVQAKNIHQHLGSEAGFEFTILPPWYRSGWAYLIYALLAGGAVFGLVKIRVHRLQTRTRQLEVLVQERTATIRQQAEKLTEMDRIKSRFFANISHEFRTPLTLILGPLEDLIAKVKDKMAKDELRVMQRNAHRLLRLINQLLDLSRLESGRMTLHVSRGDFVAFLKGIVMSFASLAEQKKITLRFEVEAALTNGSPLEIYFDRDKVEKIFYNLLSNAFKFTPEGGSVEVAVAGGSEQSAKGEGRKEKGDGRPSPHALRPTRFEESTDFVEITVRDTGIGIPAGELPRLFDRFYQADSASTREYEGSGLGLALTKELVERHYGEIEAHSEEGMGSEFIVRLPIGKEYFKPEEIVEISEQLSVTSEQLAVTSDQLSVASDQFSVTSEQDVFTPSLQQSIDPSIQQSIDPSLRHSSDPSIQDIILVVDDHPDVRSFIRKHLEPDFHVIEAKDGQEGVDAALEAIPDLVISDVMMPRLDGYQLCAALKTNAKTSHIPVILLTAKAGEENKLAGLETGADDYLIKPFSSKELHARVKNLIALRRKLREHFRRQGLLQPHEMTVPSVEEAFLQKLMQATEQHLADEDFEIDVLRRDLNMGQKQLYRKIKALTGQTPTDFIRTIRLRRAKQLLEQHAGTISEIAFQVGFNNLSYFSKCFREEFGQLPSELK